jgi:predicted phage replisome organizer
MASVKWIKLNVDMFDDEKIKIIQSMPEGDAILLVWIKLILLAGKTNEGGYIYINENMPYTEEMLSVVMNKPLNIIRLAIETFTRLGMIENDEKGIYLVNFEKHQSLDRMQEIREYNRIAQQKHRQKIKSQKMSLTSQQSKEIEEDKDIDKDKDIDNKKEINKEKSSCYFAERQWNRMLNGTEIQAFNDFDDLYGYEEVIEAIKISCMQHKCTASYVKGILSKKDKSPKWFNQDIKAERSNVEITEEDLKYVGIDE